MLLDYPYENVYNVKIERLQNMVDKTAEAVEYQLVKRLIDEIDKDPEHKLPEGVDGLIKLGYTWPGNSISGQLWYDRLKRFPNGEMIITAPIIAYQGDGIYRTKNSTYLVEVIQPQQVGIFLGDQNQDQNKQTPGDK